MNDWGFYLFLLAMACCFIAVLLTIVNLKGVQSVEDKGPYICPAAATMIVIDHNYNLSECWIPVDGDNQTP